MTIFTTIINLITIDNGHYDNHHHHHDHHHHDRDHHDPSSPRRIRQMAIMHDGKTEDYFEAPIECNFMVRGGFVKRAHFFRFFFPAPFLYADFVRKTEVDVAKLDLNFYNSRHHICTAGTAEQMNEINQRQIFSLLPCVCCSIVLSFIGDIVIIWSN